MLKHLIQKGYVNVNKLLLENYHHFGLNELEFVVLLKLFEIINTFLKIFNRKDKS